MRNWNNFIEKYDHSSGIPLVESKEFKNRDCSLLGDCTNKNHKFTHVLYLWTHRPELKTFKGLVRIEKNKITCANFQISHTKLSDNIFLTDIDFSNSNITQKDEHGRYYEVTAINKIPEDDLSYFRATGAGLKSAISHAKHLGKI